MKWIWSKVRIRMQAKTLNAIMNIIFSMLRFFIRYAGEASFYVALPPHLWSIRWPAAVSRFFQWNLTDLNFWDSTTLSKMLFKHYRVYTNHLSLIVVGIVVICHCSYVSWCYMTICGTLMLRSKRKETRITVFQVQYPRKSCHVSQKSNSP